MDAHGEICRAIDDYREKVVAVSHEIHEHPELKFEEHFAADLLTRAAKELGLEVERAAGGRPTAFCAEFGGEGRDAALAPWDGSSALAAVIQTFQSVDAMRLHLRDGSRIHGIITDGGQAVNIIPEKTECLFLARGKTSRYTQQIGARVIRCAEAAAMATGTIVDPIIEGGYKNLINNLSMAHRYAAP